MTEKPVRSSILFINPSFGRGIARIVDLFGNLDDYNYDKTEKEADSKALRRDWTIVGRDISHALEEYGRTQTQRAK